EVIEAVRTPYRIDIFQPLYFVINDFSELFGLSKCNLLDLIEKARGLGMHPPLFPPKPKDQESRFL
ncbi:MAG TPA: hypothetical protein PLD88_08670, partial [Candidatus Berkiella sp.]|nr:hypothetical protein [Candidatus Berkiella sp.]